MHNFVRSRKKICQADYEVLLTRWRRRLWHKAWSYNYPSRHYEKKKHKPTLAAEKVCAALNSYFEVFFCTHDVPSVSIVDGVDAFPEVIERIAPLSDQRILSRPRYDAFHHGSYIMQLLCVFFVGQPHVRRHAINGK